MTSSVLRDNTSMFQAPEWHWPRLPKLSRPAASAALPAAADTDTLSVGWSPQSGSPLRRIGLVVALHVAFVGAAIAWRHQAPATPPEPAAMLYVTLPDTPPPAQKLVSPAVTDDVPLPVVPQPDIQIATPVKAPVITATIAPAKPAPDHPAPAQATGDSDTTSAIAGRDDLAATLLAGAPPRYPTESRRLKEQGTVVLAVTVGEDGHAARVDIHTSSGYRRLDHAALRAVRHWRWKPFLRNGAPTIVAGLVDIPFVLAA